MPRPKMFMCYLCGREYGSSSLPIHIPQCQKKWVIEEEKKPKKERRPLPQPPKEIDEAISGGRQLSAAEIDKMNQDSYKQYENESLERCPHCDRTFRPEAYVRHKKICTAAKPFRKAGTGLGSQSLSTKLPPGAISGTMRQTMDLGNLPGRSSTPPAAAPPRPRTPQGTSLPSTAQKSANGKPMPSPLKPSTLNKTMPPSVSKASKATAAPPGRPASSAGARRGKAAGEQEQGGPALASFCDECGSAFQRPTSKFCPECGTARMAVA